MIVFLFFLTVLLPSVSDAASLMFADSFDTYTTNARLPLTPTTNWNTEDSRVSATIVASPTDGLFSPHGGSKMARCRYNGTVPLSDLANFETLAITQDDFANSEWLMRVWIRLDANFDATPSSSGAHLLRSLHTSPTTMEFVEDQITGSTLTGVRVNSSNFDINHFGSALVPGHWYKYERYVNYATGVTKTWWDGVLTTSSSTWSFAGSVFGNTNLTSNWGSPSPDATNDIYFDDFELFTDRNTGTAVTGLMSDASIQQGASSVPHSKATQGIRFSGKAGVK